MIQPHRFAALSAPLSTTHSGVAVANFTVASTPRFFKDGQWHDGDALFMRCNIWRQPAEHVTESLVKGARVVVTGRLRQRSYETSEGDQRTLIELEVDEIGPSLRYATAKVTRANRDDAIAAGDDDKHPF